MMKYNLSILKNRKVRFILNIKEKEIKINGIIKNSKQTKNSIMFVMEDKKLEIKLEVFNYMLIRYDKENDVVEIIQDIKQECLTSFLGFTMYDTYGFPIEMTNEILEEDGLNKKIDLEGFEILKQLQKDVSKNTFKNKNAF